MNRRPPKDSGAGLFLRVDAEGDAILKANLALFLMVAAAAICPPAMAADRTESDAPAAGAADPQFRIDEYRVLGNSSLAATAIEAAVYPYLGPEKTIKDVEAARKALEEAYHQAGLGTVFVDIPEQEIAEGVVRLRVTEGKLRTTRVSGARYFSNREIRNALPAATEETVPNLPSLQNELTKLNAQTSDRAVVPVLKAGPTPGTVDLSLKVVDQLPFHGSVEINNQETPDTKPLRTLVSMNYDDMFGRLDSLALQYQFAPQALGQYGVLVASYTLHLNDEGTRWSFQYIDSSSDISAIGALAILGKGKIFGTRLTQPITLSAESSQSFSLGVDYKDFAEDIEVDPDSTLKTPISYVNFSLAYSGAWRRDIFQWGFDSTLNFGIRGLKNDDTEFADKRFGAYGNYAYLRSNASFGARLPADFTIILRLSGQYAPAPIISNEQFTIGGADSVRGFLEAEELGDMGIKSTLQLGTPQLKLLRGKFIADAFVFYDVGRVNTIDSLPGEPSNSELRSLGAGINLSLLQHMTGALSWAYPLNDGLETRAHDGRVLFFLRGMW
ncbi:MAG TPA: ShlB/FhaC/HecB family hemolysin secretion/activation protein [Steroidobacteraceae bacterium]